MALPGRDVPPRLDDYSRMRAEHAVVVPDTFNPVVEIVEAWAAEAPGDVALVSVDGAGAVTSEHTVADLAAESRRAARALLELGIRKGDRVLVMVPRDPAWYAAVLGAIRIGAVVMPATNQLTSKDLSYRIDRAGAVAVITDAVGVAKVDAIQDLPAGLKHRICVTGSGSAEWHDLTALMAEVGDGETPAQPTRRDDPMILFFTSGTVSLPKMVVHDQSYGLGHVTTARYWHDLRPGDRHWTVADTGWAKAAWGSLFGQWHERATVVQVALGKPTADLVLGIIRDVGVTSFCAPPTLYRLLVQADLASYDLRVLRHCTSAGEPLNPEVIRAWADGTGGLTVYDGYGQSETTLLVANFRSVPVRPGSMGLPVPGWDVDVVDEEGKPAPDDVVADVAVRVTDPWPVGLFHGYDGDDEATAKAFHHGWYYTGDKAARDADGYLWFEGRNDDVITSSAYRIGPFEVESALVEHAAVAECAVVGKSHPERTQVVTAFVVLAEGWTGDDALTGQLQEHVRQVTAPYKYPREIYYVTELPKTVSGKIRRSELRERLASGAIG
jgi:acyl-coenzyme A synthetase/AMP-(fatty) acid ligase